MNSQAWGVGVQCGMAMQPVRCRHGLKAVSLLMSPQKRWRNQPYGVAQCSLGRKLVCTAVLKLDFLGTSTKQIVRKPFPSLIDPKGPVPNGEFLPMELKAPVPRHKPANLGDVPLGHFSTITNESKFARMPGHSRMLEPSGSRSYGTVSFAQQAKKRRERIGGSGKGLGEVLSPDLATKEQRRWDEKRKELDPGGYRTFDGRICEMILPFGSTSRKKIAALKITKTERSAHDAGASTVLPFSDPKSEPEPAPVVSTELQKQQFIEPNRPDEADNAILEDLSVDSLFSNASLSTSVDDRDGNPSDQSAVEEVGQINETVGGDIITGSADLVLLDSEVPSTNEQASSESTLVEVLDSEHDEKVLEPLMAEPPPDVLIVMNVSEAQQAMKQLREYADSPNRVFACDTEVMNIDVASESPCGHGEVICFSIYCGADANFTGTPNNGMQQPHIWVDLIDKEAFDAGKEDFLRMDILEEFREFFEDEKYMKCWHNYGFDRHVMANPPLNIHCKGFAGDTMHMARLWDSSRKLKGYSLESLSTDKQVMGEFADDSAKTSMKSIFGYKKMRKDGTEGKAIVMDPVERLQLDDRTRNMWIHYSARDAKVSQRSMATFHLRDELKKRLSDEILMECKMDPALAKGYKSIKTMWDFYCQIWLPFGELLTDMEKEGFYVDVDQLSEAQSMAEKDKIEAANRFRIWALARVPGAEHMNVNSDAQVRTLLFAGVKNHKNGIKVDMEKTFKYPNPLYDEHIKHNLPGKKPLKNMEFQLHSAWGHDAPSKLTPPIWTASGWPASSTPALKALVGKHGAARKLLEENYGVAVNSPANDIFDDEDDPEMSSTKDFSADYKTRIAMDKSGVGELCAAFGGGKKGLEACVAVESLLEVSSIDTLLSNFIIPLQEDNIKTSNGRIHASLNINTETGRLSCRRPNLQNQPALEKDRYKVRRTFTADRRNGKKNTLIVADYGQLELRILAHLTNCRSMLEAFKSGGDFHSRTALGMYDNIKEAVKKGNCLLEWDGADGEDPPFPLLKDKFPNERRRAKVLNFSLAYGKTVHGLAKDWNVSKKEAEDTLNRWYSDRQEVKQWQEEVRKQAKNRSDGHYVTTIMGRRRNLPEIVSSRPGPRGHAERAAINTPIQGSAADIAAAAMLCIHNNERLIELGWKLLLQVHDEVILEGPEESAEEAQKIVVFCLEHPFPAPGGGYHNPLKVDLAVDCNTAHTWYEAK